MEFSSSLIHFDDILGTFCSALRLIVFTPFFQDQHRRYYQKAIRERTDDGKKPTFMSVHARMCFHSTLMWMQFPNIYFTSNNRRNAEEQNKKKKSGILGNIFATVLSFGLYRACETNTTCFILRLQFRREWIKFIIMKFLACFSFSKQNFTYFDRLEYIRMKFKIKYISCIWNMAHKWAEISLLYAA